MPTYRYDTTELWADSKPDTPQFRNIKGWDLQFRKNAWAFFQAVLDPAQASHETLAIVNATRRQGTVAFVFETYDDGTPILTDKENGKIASTTRRQHILREYLRIHYCTCSCAVDVSMETEALFSAHAKAIDVRSVPWQSLSENPDRFFAAGMVPNGFVFQDPSHINDAELVKFYTHVFKLEHPGEYNLTALPVRFRFSHFETGPKGNRSYIPAIYDGTVPTSQPQRQKKSARVPGFDGDPSDDETEPTRGSEPPAEVSPPAAPSRGVVAGTSRMAAALVADFAKVQASLASEGSATPPTQLATPEPSVDASGTSSQPKGKGKAVAPWIAATVDAASTMGDAWDDENELFGPWSSPPPLLDASDEEVEDVLNFVSAGPKPLNDNKSPSLATDMETSSPANCMGSERTEPTLTSSLSTTALDPVSRTLSVRPLASPEAPCSVQSERGARFAYLLSLLSDPSYQALLRAFEAKVCSMCGLQRHALTNVILQLCEPTVIRAKSPVLWATWGLRSAHVPKSILTSVKNVKTLMNWVEKGRDCSGSASDIQRYCLVLGLLLSDLDFIDRTPGDVAWPEGLPEYLAYSQLDDTHRILITHSCDTQAAEHGGEDVDDAVAPFPGTDSADNGTVRELPTMESAPEVPKRARSTRNAKVCVEPSRGATTGPIMPRDSGNGGRRTRSKARGG